MLRIFTVLSFTALLSFTASAADNGGFGEKFSNRAPSALMESPDSQIAQTAISPSAQDLQNIMPAAGDDEPADQFQGVSPAAVLQTQGDASQKSPGENVSDPTR